MNTSPLPRDLEFPEDQDPEAFHSTSVIGGEFGITAELPKLNDINGRKGAGSLVEDTTL